MGLVSIGELSKRTGISVLRLRAWESRYGFPTAHVLESGHRRYNQEVINRTVLISQLLEKGFRVGKVIHLENEMMAKMLSERREIGFESKESKHSFVEAFEYVVELNESKFTSYWENCSNHLSTLDFLSHHACPFLVELGEKWENGVLDVSHEHFASKILEHIIEKHWRERNLKLQGDVSILALLPNEYHALGLHFAACLCVSRNQKVLFLGERTPINAILETASKTPTKRVILSVSETYDLHLAEKYIRSLVEKFPSSIELWVGGSGAPELEGVVKIASLEELDQLLGEEK